MPKPYKYVSLEEQRAEFTGSPVEIIQRGTATIELFEMPDDGYPHWNYVAFVTIGERVLARKYVNGTKQVIEWTDEWLRPGIQDKDES